jgi:poly(A) polymerase
MKKEKIQFNRELTDLEKAGLLVIQKLRDKKYEAYFAGGYVRDIKLGLIPHDIDIATSAKPEKIEKIFSRTIPTGKAFGVIRVKENGLWFEVATFRIDLPSKDARHPAGIKFTSAKEDAKRRDFTINALFFDPVKSEIIDYVGGLKDLKNKTLKFIGSAQKRINDDHLRILRAVRFKNALGFKMSKTDLETIKKNAEKIITVSAERIQDEFRKMLTRRNRAKSIEDLEKLKILKHILPELSATRGVKQPPQFHSEGDVWVHTLMALKNLSPDASEELAWATLLHDIGKPATQRTPERHGTDRIRFSGHEVESAEMALKILKRLKFSRKKIETIVWLVKNHMRFMHIKKMRQAKQRRLLQHPLFQNLLELSHADISSSLNPEKKAYFSDYDYALQIWNEEQNRPAEQKKKKLVDGNDIMKEFKLKPGPNIGKILEAVQDAYLEGKLNVVTEEKGKEKIDKKPVFDFIKKNCKKLL